MKLVFISSFPGIPSVFENDLPDNTVFLVKFELCLSHTVGSWLCFPHDSAVKNLPATQYTQERWVRSLGREDPLEEGMTTHSSIFTWEIPWTEKPGGLQSVGLHRVAHNGAHTHTHTREGDLVHRWKRSEFLISTTKFYKQRGRTDHDFFFAAYYTDFVILNA